MSIQRLFHYMAAAFLALSAASVSAGYLVDVNGKVVMNNYDECVHSLGTLGPYEGPAPVECGGIMDSDGDGVPDDMDKCPDTPAGMKVDADGCHDSDGDGVANADDQCPGTPRGIKVDRTGCEILAPVVLEGVHFDYNKSTLTPAAKSVLDENVAKIMRNAKRIKAIRVVGHTDSHGSQNYNQGLSERRAKSVAAYLKEKGVDVGIMAEGMGESQPVADNATREGRARNRRVEISFE